MATATSPHPSNETISVLLHNSLKKIKSLTCSISILQFTKDMKIIKNNYYNSMNIENKNRPYKKPVYTIKLIASFLVEISITLTLLTSYGDFPAFNGAGRPQVHFMHYFRYQRSPE